MEQLVYQENVFICFLLVGEFLGGVVCKIWEVIILCEVVGYDIILIEIVGVGQFEIVVYFMIDFFFLFLLLGVGDELQGIKWGIVEMVDFVVVNKVDGECLLFVK